MEKEEKNKNNTNETAQVEENKKTNEKANNKKEQKRKNSKLRMMLVILFLLVFSGVSYVQLRGSYLEYLELGSQYIDIFKTNLIYRYSIMAINFVFLYIVIYFTNRGIKKGLKPFFEKEKRPMPKLLNKSLALVISAVVSFVVSSAFMQKIMLIFNGTSFGNQDPIFGLDIAYYMFQKPVIEMLLFYFVVLFVGLSLYMALYYVIVFNKYFNGIDKETLRKYRQIFEIRNESHVWNSLDDKGFLEKLGGYRKDRKTGVEGLTLAGLLMFGTGQAIRERFDNVFMDYRNESQVTADIRWNDRITYDGTWENNLFNFFTKVTPKLTEDLKRPFKLEGGVQRIDDTPVHKAVREGFVNMIIHADYLMDSGVLKVIKRENSFEFTNPGILKLPLEDIYRGGNSKSRNPHMQTMLRLVGFGDNAGSGFPTILSVWKLEGWGEPELIEDTNLNQVTLVMKMEKTSAEKSAEKSADSADYLQINGFDLSKRQKQILAYMDAGVEYSTEQIAEELGLKGARTRQLLNELVDMGLLDYFGTTKRRRYIKHVNH